MFRIFSEFNKINVSLIFSEETKRFTIKSETDATKIKKKVFDILTTDYGEKSLVAVKLETDLIEAIYNNKGSLQYLRSKPLEVRLNKDIAIREMLLNLPKEIEELNDDYVRYEAEIVLHPFDTSVEINKALVDSLFRLTGAMKEYKENVTVVLNSDGEYLCNIYFDDFNIRINSFVMFAYKLDDFINKLFNLVSAYDRHVVVDFNVVRKYSWN